MNLVIEQGNGNEFSDHKNTIFHFDDDEISTFTLIYDLSDNMHCKMIG